MLLKISAAFLLSFMFFLVAYMTTRAADDFTSVTYQINTQICTWNGPNISVEMPPVQGATCWAECNGVKKFATSDTSGKCIVNFPKDQCKERDQLFLYSGTCGCDLHGVSCQNHLMSMSEPHTFNSGETMFNILIDQPNINVPEFGAIGVGLTGIISLAGYLFLRTKSIV